MRPVSPPARTLREPLTRRVDDFGRWLSEVVLVGHTEDRLVSTVVGCECGFDHAGHISDIDALADQVDNSE
ncbi:MAG: hypothetical protein ACI8TL_000695 [Natronomonas sp.]